MLDYWCLFELSFEAFEIFVVRENFTSDASAEQFFSLQCRQSTLNWAEVFVCALCGCLLVTILFMRIRHIFPLIFFMFFPFPQPATRYVSMSGSGCTYTSFFLSFSFCLFSFCLFSPADSKWSVIVSAFTPLFSYPYTVSVVVLLTQFSSFLSNTMYSSSVDTEHNLMSCNCYIIIWCMLSGVMVVLVFCFFRLYSILCICVFSPSAAWVARPRVRQMKRLLWWALTTAIQPCLSALVRSSEIIAVLHRANRPAARSEFIFLLPP